MRKEKVLGHYEIQNFEFEGISMKEQFRLQ